MISMKNQTLLFTICAMAAALMTSEVGASAQMVTALTQTSGTTLPGDPNNYDLPYAKNALTDFSAGNLGFGGSENTINLPDGTSSGWYGLTYGEEFYSSTPQDLLDLTVLSTAPSAYDVSVLFGLLYNGYYQSSDGTYVPGTADHRGTSIDGSITLTLENSSGVVLSSATLNTTDDSNPSVTTGFFANFSVTGSVAGDILHILPNTDPTQNVDAPYLGGVGITTPEPSTYAMLMTGLGALAFFIRRRKLA